MSNGYGIAGHFIYPSSTLRSFGREKSNFYPSSISLLQFFCRFLHLPSKEQNLSRNLYNPSLALLSV